MMKVTIDKEFHSLIPPLSEEEYGQLEKNLVAEGCRDALVVWDGLLLDGHNRREICRKYKLEYKVKTVDLKDRDAAIIWIINNQFGRRNLNNYQRAKLALRLKPLLAKAAKKTQGQRTDLCQKSDKSSPAADTKKSLARAAKVSHDTIVKVEVIEKKATPKVKARLAAGETTVNKEYKAIVKAERKAKQVEAVKLAKLPDGKFHVIVADPPWSYDSRAGDSTHRAANPYPSMLLVDIKSLPVEDRANDDCILWLWTTNAFMVQAHEVAKEWGFQVKTILTWAKDRIGTGDWLRGKTEHCLMCVRGKPVVMLTNQSTLLEGPLREHSRKPNEFYAMVESLCPGTKCEFFSREKRKGWTAFGAEIGAFS